MNQLLLHPQQSAFGRLADLTHPVFRYQNLPAIRLAFRLPLLISLQTGHMQFWPGGIS